MTEQTTIDQCTHCKANPQADEGSLCKACITEQSDRATRKEARQTEITAILKGGGTHPDLPTETDTTEPEGKPPTDR